MKNKLKNAVIAALLVSTLLLTYTIWSYTLGTSGTGLLRLAFGVEAPESVHYAGYEELSYALRVITPLSCAVRESRDGALYGTTDRETASACFERIGSLLAEALETAQTPREATAAEWRSALGGTMVFLDFGGRVPLSTLARLLGAQAPEDLTADARYVAVCVQGSGDRAAAVLYYMEADGTVQRCRTEADADYLSMLTAEWTPNGYRFAFEERLTDSAMLLMPSDTIPALDISNPLSTAAEADFDRIMENVLESLGFNAYRPSVYSESDGTRVYVEEERTLRAYGNGRVTYSDPGAAGTGSAEPSAAEKTAQIAEAAHLASQIVTSYLGDARLFLLDTDYDDGAFTVRFGVECGGMRILTKRGNVASLTFRDSVLCAAELELRTYRRNGTSVTVLPASQALAAAGSARDFGLYYREEDGAVKAGWYIGE